MKTLLSILFITAAFLVQPVQAQFEGKMVFSSYEVENGEEGTENDEFTVYLTPDRIFVQGTDEYEMMGEIGTEGVLIRLDEEDFIIMTGEEQALQISKSDIDGMMNMMGGGNANSAPETEVKIEPTGESRTILDFNCEQYRVEDAETPDEYALFWMTKDVPVDLKALGESWGESLNQMNSEDVPYNQLFDDGLFPLRIESYQRETLINVVEAKEVTETSEAREMVEIPSGVEVLSFQDFLFQNMSNQ